MPSSAPPFAHWPQPVLLDQGREGSIAAGVSSYSLPINAVAKQPAALFIGVAVLRGGDSGSWSGFDFSQNLLAATDSLRFVVGAKVNPSTSPTFTRSGTSLHRADFLSLTAFPFGGVTVTYANLSGAYTGAQNTTSITYPAQSSVDNNDLRIIIAAGEELSGGSAGIPLINNMVSKLNSNSTPRQFRIAIEDGSYLGSSIPSQTEALSTSHATGILTLNIRNRLR